MARILITGSSDGLGLLTAKRLLQSSHKVTLHARNPARAQSTQSACPNATAIVTGDLSSLAQTKQLAKDINALGPFDTIIHNAGLYRGPYRETEDGIPALAAVNTVAPYVLSCLIERPKRVVFLSSSMHYSADVESALEDPFWVGKGEKGWSDNQAYCNSKLHSVILARRFAELWPETVVTVMDPGWVATKMGGKSAPGDPELAVQTYVLLALGEEGSARVRSGSYWTPGGKEDEPKSGVKWEESAERLFKACREFSEVGIKDT
ncbi:short-chain dehydrogenase [Amniculicola lignicola CBS 123094]|uniref:Short-chain dehydrogenase n=1 Tax=Amniculicola lignicola CBS 123094 TaxID=1392246 RepID=A0A6A5WPD6_9PLEO|nr:short-chain dehydrogenase [Amniculicola lignicola CBS 123094]